MTCNSTTSFENRAIGCTRSGTPLAASPCAQHQDGFGPFSRYMCSSTVLLSLWHSTIWWKDKFFGCRSNIWMGATLELFLQLSLFRLYCNPFMATLDWIGEANSSGVDLVQKAVCKEQSGTLGWYTCCGTWLENSADHPALAQKNPQAP